MGHTNLSLLSDSQLETTSGGIIVIGIGFFIIGVGVGFFAARKIFKSRRKPRRL